MFSLTEDSVTVHRACLSLDNVDVWWASLSVPERVGYAFSKILSSDERERVGRFVFPRDQHRFVVAQAMLRNILAQYLGQRPQEISFHYESHGKPRLRAKDPGVDLELSLACSHEIALCAVSHGR